MTEDEVRRQLLELLRGAGSAAAAWPTLDQRTAAREYLQLLAADGWVVPSWPAELGGRGAPPDIAAVIDRVRLALGGPDLYPFLVGLGLVGPTMLVHGTREQQQRWCGPIISGEQIWCQMFSEPDAGSDLAAVATLAEPSRGSWSVTGQKVWTSRASYADFGLCLVRTNPHATKHAGLTMLVVDMRQPGVTVRPLVQMNRDAHFSEVFLDAVQIPDACRIGAVDGGWSVALSVLAFERALFGQQLQISDPLRLPEPIAVLAREKRLVGGLLRDAAARAYTLEVINRLTMMRSAERGGVPGPEGSGGKLRNVAAYRAMADLVVRCAGATGMLNDSPSTEAVLTAPSMSIRGGTDEIQRNIIAERTLGLPAEPRADRNLSWRDARSARASGRND